MVVSDRRSRVLLTLSYWILSSGLTLYNKWLFNSWGFSFPILLIILTNTVNFILSWIWLQTTCWHSPLEVRRFRSFKHRVHRSQAFWRFMVPIGVLSGLEIALSNMSLMEISVSFHTMVQASKPAFVFFWSVLFRLQPLDRGLLAAVFLIVGGVMVVAVSKLEDSPGPEPDDSSARILGNSSTSQERNGLILMLVSAFLSGGRWATTELLLRDGALSALNFQSLPSEDEDDENTFIALQEADVPSYSTPEPSTSVPSNFRRQAPSLESIHLEDTPADQSEQNNSPAKNQGLPPIQLLHLISPVCIVCLLPLFLIFELPTIHDLLKTSVAWKLSTSLLIVTCSVIALCLIMVEFYFIKKMSSLTLSIVAIFKEIILVLISSMLFATKVSLLAGIGFLITLTGGFYYQFQRHNAKDPKEGVSTLNELSNAVELSDVQLAST